MSKIKEVFFRDAYQESRGVTKDEVISFVKELNATGDEGTQFDAKDFGAILGRYNRLELDRVRLSLGKHISSFANSSGGLIIIGLSEDKNRDKFDTKKMKRSKFTLTPHSIEDINLQHLQRIITTSVEPKADFLLETVIMGQKGKRQLGVILLYIEESLHPPHQAIINKTYYFRHGESSIPAPHSLVMALFTGRKKPKLEIDLIKVNDPDSKQRLLIKNKGNSPAYHTQIIINIFPALVKDNKLLLNEKIIEETTDGLWIIKSSLGGAKKDSMKFRLRSRREQIILPFVNEVLFDLPKITIPNAKIKVNVYCEGDEVEQEFTLS